MKTVAQGAPVANQTSTEVGSKYDGEALKPQLSWQEQNIWFFFTRSTGPPREGNETDEFPSQLWVWKDYLLGRNMGPDTCWSFSHTQTILWLA